MQLRFAESDIADLSARYSYARKEALILKGRESVRAKGYLTKAELQQLAEWKSPRSAGRIGENTDGFVREITAFALAAADERSRIETLTILSGVMWPTASAILHFYHKDAYPILDYRALWSLSTPQPTMYDFGFWHSYVAFTRGLMQQARVDSRTLDRALWQYSKENQRNLQESADLMEN